MPEKKFIERIRRMAGNSGHVGLVRGIGDDAAILCVANNHQLLVTTDLCIEDVHFRRAWHPARSVGHRCLARGLSDLAAMGGEPLACFLSLGLPPALPRRWVDDFVRGLLGEAARFGVPLAGGDVSAADKIMADIVVTGQVPAGQALLRSGASAEDRIYVTGELGGSAAILRRMYSGEKIRAAKSSRHFFPAPRLDQARWLREKRLATAMIDLSDGLSVDLAHICTESGVEAVIDAGRLPIAKGADLGLAVHGGEDYELLFTAARKARVPSEIAGVRVTEIGEVVPKSRSRTPVQLRAKDGAISPLPPAGWQHFSESC